MVKKAKKVTPQSQRLALALAAENARQKTEKLKAEAKKEWSVMQVALIVSAAMHIIILSLHFEPELKRFKDQLPVLEVMLVNAKSQNKPKNAEVHAQANLDRGGNTEQDRTIKSALPSTSQAPSDTVISANIEEKSAKKQTHNPLDAEEKEQQRLAALEKQAQQLMIQLKSTAKVETKVLANTKVADANKSAQVPLDKATMDEINQTLLEMNRLEALIAKQQEEYQKRPKRKFIGARATEYRYAMYVDNWRQKVEKIGNQNYPIIAKQKKLYGQLQLTVSIKKDGSIENIELNRSSGHKILDEAAKHIVELGAPYTKFSPDIASETDVLSITRTWTFTRQDSVSTQE